MYWSSMNSRKLVISTAERVRRRDLGESRPRWPVIAVAWYFAICCIQLRRVTSFTVMLLIVAPCGAVASFPFRSHEYIQCYSYPMQKAPFFGDQAFTLIVSSGCPSKVPTTPANALSTNRRLAWLKRSKMDFYPARATSIWLGHFTLTLTSIDMILEINFRQQIVAHSLIQK